jgi:hypothetical protein
MNYDKAFMMFGTVWKGIAYHVPLSEWQKHAKEAWDWCLHQVES